MLNAKSRTTFIFPINFFLLGGVFISYPYFKAIKIITTTQETNHNGRTK